MRRLLSCVLPGLALLLGGPAARAADPDKAAAELQRRGARLERNDRLPGSNESRCDFFPLRDARQRHDVLKLLVKRADRRIVLKPAQFPSRFARRQIAGQLIKPRQLPRLGEKLN